ncbi:hypothetical protein AYO40_00815 [Planctomycetaceae bacterium SCGC AG-212-D15]|nr:hypothetical protein AYO40_00815 [Planctomycetaceae bacterium SCGC AG-212-D15]
MEHAPAASAEPSALDPAVLESVLRSRDWVKGAVNHDEDLHFSTFYLRASCTPATGNLYPGYTTLVAFYEDFRETYFLLRDECTAAARAIVEKALADPAWLPGIVAEIRARSDALATIFPCEMSPRTIAELPPAQLLNQYVRHNTTHQALYHYARVPEALDRGVGFFSGYLLDHLRATGLSRIEASDLLAALTEPVTPSVLAQELIEFDEIVGQARIKLQSNRPLPDDPGRARFFFQPEVLSRLEAHREKWQFITYHGYGRREPATLGTYIRRLLQQIKDSNGRPGRTRSPRPDALRARSELLARLPLDPAHRALFEVFPELGAVKLYRRMAQLRNFYYLDMLLAEIAARIGVNEWTLRCMLPEEVVRSLQAGKLIDPAIAERTRGCAYVLRAGREYLLVGEPAQRLRHVVCPAPSAPSNGTLRGTVACRGKAVGRCKVVVRADDHPEDFPRGAILVSESTDPDLIGLIQKASAVLTEQGGVTAHAAIICRELGIPTIIGIEGLLNRVHDGDVVDVDADTGRVILPVPIVKCVPAMAIMDQRPPERIGAKAHNLSVVRGLGFSVPDYVLLDPSTVRRAFAHAADDSLDALTGWVSERLSLADDGEVAIRSSAVSEDGETASRAGEFCTLLGIRRDRLIAALREFLRHNERGRNGATYAGSIVVQRMVHADFSGVCLTRDRRLGKDNAVFLEWVAGSNESVTGGTVVPARVVVDRMTGDIVEDECPSARLPMNVVGLAQQFLALEARYGKPLDIEWAIVDRCLYILQARPIVRAAPNGEPRV